MDFVQLTETQRRDFNENGYLIVPQALDRATVDRLIEAGDRLMESFEYEDYYAHRRPGLIQEEDAYASLITNSSTVPLIVQLLGPNIHITNTALIYKHPQVPKHLPSAIGTVMLGFTLTLDIRNCLVSD